MPSDAYFPPDMLSPYSCAFIKNNGKVGQTRLACYFEMLCIQNTKRWEKRRAQWLMYAYFRE